MIHTPGPWTTERLNGSDWGHLVHIGDELDVLVQNADPDEELANARLIAAAPELLEAAKAILEREDQRDDFADPLLEKLRLAIRKSEGRAEAGQ